MTPLLIVGLALLVIVAVLSIWQRRQQRETRSAGRTVGTAGDSRGAAGDAADPSDDPDWPFRDDPVFGELTWDQERSWRSDSAREVAGEHLDVELLAGREGPGARHREWFEAARRRGAALFRDARAALQPALAAQGVPADDLSPSEMSLGAIAADGAFIGRVVFDADDERIELLEVRSADLWRTFEARVEVRAGLPAGADRMYPPLGTIAYDGDGCWSAAEPFAVSGRSVAVVLLAGAQGPDDEYAVWLRALAARGAALFEEAANLALRAAPPGLTREDLGGIILVLAPDGVGGVLGGVTYEWSSGRSDAERLDVWSRDRWQTLSLERG